MEWRQIDMKCCARCGRLVHSVRQNKRMRIGDDQCCCSYLLDFLPQLNGVKCIVSVGALLLQFLQGEKRSDENACHARARRSARTRGALFHLRSRLIVTRRDTLTEEVLKPPFSVSRHWRCATSLIYLGELPRLSPLCLRNMSTARKVVVVDEKKRNGIRALYLLLDNHNVVETLPVFAKRAQKGAARTKSN